MSNKSEISAEIVEIINEEIENLLKVEEDIQESSKESELSLQDFWALEEVDKKGIHKMRKKHKPLLVKLEKLGRV